MASAVAALAASCGFAAAQVPSGPPVYQMNLSTIIMPCNGAPTPP